MILKHDLKINSFLSSKRVSLDVHIYSTTSRVTCYNLQDDRPVGQSKLTWEEGIVISVFSCFWAILRFTIYIRETFVKAIEGYSLFFPFFSLHGYLPCPCGYYYDDSHTYDNYWQLIWRAWDGLHDTSNPGLIEGSTNRSPEDLGIHIGSHP